ncbi:MAG: hypothetical protein ACNI27_14900 [Desulfovibrio sp.]
MRFILLYILCCLVLFPGHVFANDAGSDSIKSIDELHPPLSVIEGVVWEKKINNVFFRSVVKHAALKRKFSGGISFFFQHEIEVEGITLECHLKDRRELSAAIQALPQMLSAYPARWKDIGGAVYYGGTVEFFLRNKPVFSISAREIQTTNRGRLYLKAINGCSDSNFSFIGKSMRMSDPFLKQIIYRSFVDNDPR